MNRRKLVIVEATDMWDDIYYYIDSVFYNRESQDGLTGLAAELDGDACLFENQQFGDIQFEPDFSPHEWIPRT